MTSILRLPDVIKTVSLSRSSIYAMVKDGKFPKPIPLGERAVGWTSESIQNWIEEQTKKVA